MHRCWSVVTTWLRIEGPVTASRAGRTRPIVVVQGTMLYTVSSSMPRAVEVVSTLTVYLNHIEPTCSILITTLNSLENPRVWTWRGLGR